MNGKVKFKVSPIAAAVSSALLIGSAGPVLAQDEALEEITVTGIRGSLRSSMNIKRDSTGVVDAISAEDIGKFPDTNLAESMQRITGVSIDRLNGEGSQVTVRGFGPGYNLVTHNGRTIPTAEVGLVGGLSSYAGGAGRSFDFSNIASEGVQSLEVIKTGQATLPSGGIGATINIETFKPLDSGGTQGTFGVKALADTSVSEGDSVTPELTGLYSWVDDNETFGVTVFGAYSERDSGGASAYVNDYLFGRGPGLSSGYLRADGSTQLTNPPGDGELWAIPQDSRNDFSDLTRERLNGQITAQFRPTDGLTLTADYMYIANETQELRYEQTNWYATPMDQIVMDTSGPVLIPTFMQENNDGTKDVGFEQTYRQQKDEINGFGFNAEWQMSESQSFRFDAHTSSGESTPDNPLGHSATFTAIAAPVVVQHSTDYSSEAPQQFYTFDDSARGNNNGVLDVGDLASQVWRSASNWQEMDVDEFDLRYTLEGDGGGRLDFGVNYRGTDIFLRSRTTQQDLGSWGMANARDIEQYAPGVVEEFCMACEFDDFPAGDTDVAFRADATELFRIMTPIYEAFGNGVTVADTQNWVEEDIISLYAQFSTETEFMGKDLEINGGLRYEQSDVTATALQPVPTGILWILDNDFLITYGPEQENVVGEGDYNHLLPNIDFRLNVTDDVVARMSYSQTVGRVPYGNLIASTTAGAPNRPTVLGGVTGGNSQNPALLPLESENFDLSVEWYYGDASYVSVGYFDKTVENFLGTGVFERPLFGLLDPTAGVPGSRSGAALDIINDIGVDQSEAHLFTLVALIDANGGDLAAAQAEFEANLVNGVLPQGYVDQIGGQYDVTGDANDPEMIFRVTQPINQEEGNIHGWELAWQHFFGDTGFGLSANYTIVEGDVEADDAGDPNDNQFALVGLSDTANLSVIYENFGWSARVSYNWRDSFLNATNQGGGRSPQYTDEYGQIDASVAWDVTDNIQLSFEGINLSGDNLRQYRRKESMFIWGYEYEPRYAFGARYRFN
ncbi:MAG TPA: TonB-dependent receptor [Woeseiaceae bacterium]|nr:TonB-dependent receptor [Woeseiaceae bacterium]